MMLIGVLFSPLSAAIARRKRRAELGIRADIYLQCATSRLESATRPLEESPAVPIQTPEIVIDSISDTFSRNSNETVP